jgi:hypothetical protein
MSKKNQLLIITGCWCIVQFILYSKLGVRPILESHKYIEAAKHLLNTGELPGVRYLFYLSTTLIIAASLSIGTGFGGVVILQLFINLFATLFYFSSLNKIQKNSYSAFITTLLLIFCIPSQIWNFYLYTESIFFSCTLLFFASCIRYNAISIQTALIQFFFLLLAIISRPLGILLLPCWILYIISKSNKRYRHVLLFALLIASVLFATVCNLILGNINDWEILKPAEYNNLICELPTSARMNLDHLKHQLPLNQLLSYLYYYPDEFLKVAVQRWKLFFLQTRDYYSFNHNLFRLALDAILYVPIILNIICFAKGICKKIIVLPVVIIFFFFVAIGLQCDDYHNRFHNAIIPVFLYAGLFLLLENIRLFKKETSVK